MPRGISLNNFQKGQISAYKNVVRGVWEIANILNISPNTVFNLIKNPGKHGKKKKTGRPKKLKPRDERKLVRELKKNGEDIVNAQINSGLRVRT